MSRPKKIVLKAASPRDACLQLKQFLYANGGNVHRLAAYADMHEGNLAHRLSGNVDVRLSTLLEMQMMVNAFVEDN